MAKEISILATKDMAGSFAQLYGWVANRRDHGKLIFLDLRDRTGTIQVVFTPKTPNYAEAQKLRNEWVVRINGKINPRPEKMVNPDIPTGMVEVEPLELEILNEAVTPPFPLDGDGYDIGEEHRMKYRYVDLRRERMAKNIAARHRAAMLVRHCLTEHEFIEVETPVLTKSTPEGARDYVVPSRLYPGHFYALPQSPQQYKQLLMSGGIEKYFQFARCFRDEDTRADRQPEFTQLDMEMSFVERDDVMALNERLLIEIVHRLYPEKQIQELPFPRITYKEAMDKYKTDRPDLRKDKSNPNLLSFCWVVDFPFFEEVKSGDAVHSEALAKEWTFTHNPFSAPKPEHRQWLMDKTNIGDILTTQYDVVLNGFEIGGGSIRNHQPEALKRVFQIMGFPDERIEANFGHMLAALGSGTPPHGGIAWGFDRLIAELQHETSIREVIAFPKTGDARDLMMDSPSELEQKQLRELHLTIKK